MLTQSTQEHTEGGECTVCVPGEYASYVDITQTNIMGRYSMCT